MSKSVNHIFFTDSLKPKYLQAILAPAFCRYEGRRDAGS